MPQIRPHRSREREVLRGRAMISCPCQREAKAELRVVITGAGVHDAAEAARRLDVVPGIELRASERLEDAPRVGLSSSGPLQKLGRRRGAATPEQVHAATVKGIYVFLPGSRPIGRARLFAGTGILAA
jgi:hypothetical protein